MKLLTRTNILFISLTLIVFSLGGKVFYERVHAINKFDASERLNEEKEKVLNYVKINHTLPQNAFLLGDSVSFSPIETGNGKDKTGHVKLYNSQEKEYEPFQTLQFPVAAGNGFYGAVIYHPLLESDDLTTAIVQAMAIIGGCLLVVLLFANFIISKIMWLPFYRTLEKIKSFNLAKENKVEFQQTGIFEFKTLNEVLKKMTYKIASDYRTLKEFTENASHEMQTPLSIIQSKLELMIQSKKMDAGQMMEIQAVYQSAARLAKLNQALLLLAKIENNQFTELQSLSLDELIKHKLEFFDELIQHKHISVEIKMQPVTVNMHPMLADILLSNLIGNAIRHNMEGGKLSVELNQKKLLIKNSGNPLNVDPTLLFERFRKANPASDSLGLGLALVKEICTVCGFALAYKYEINQHIISIRF